MTESEYEAWFETYLGEVESLDKPDAGDSPLSHAPKPVRRRLWILACAAGLATSTAGSCGLAYAYERTGSWLCSWGSAALQSLAVGLLASLLLMLYTSVRDRNAIYYADILPLLERRSGSMRKAFFAYNGQIRRRFRDGDFDGYYEAWRCTCNTSFVALEFLRYLTTMLPFRPKCFRFTQADLDRAKAELGQAGERIQRELFQMHTISEEACENCCEAAQHGYQAIRYVDALAAELRAMAFGLRYGGKARDFPEAGD